MTNAAGGDAVIKSFLKYYARYNGRIMTEAELFSKILRFEPAKFKTSLGYAFIEGLQARQDRLDAAMDSLAKKTRGGLPDTSSFFAVMRDQNSLVNMLADVGDEVAEDVNEFAKQLGGIYKFAAYAFLLGATGYGLYVIYKNKDLLVIKKS